MEKFKYAIVTKKGYYEQNNTDLVTYDTYEEACRLLNPKIHNHVSQVEVEFKLTFKSTKNILPLSTTLQSKLSEWRIVMVKGTEVPLSFSQQFNIVIKTDTKLEESIIHSLWEFARDSRKQVLIITNDIDPYLVGLSDLVLEEEDGFFADRKNRGTTRYNNSHTLIDLNK